MKLLEYQAKELFSIYGLPVQKGIVLTDKSGFNTDKSGINEIECAGLKYPLVIKAQIQAGGRGKAGGIRFAQNAGEAREIIDSMLLSKLKGYIVNALFVGEKAEIEAEWYLSMILDRDIKAPRILFSKYGGTDIEETAARAPEAVVSVPVNPLYGVPEHTIRYICSKGGVGGEYADRLKDTLTRLAKLFMDYSCMIAEINPLAITPDGGLLAIDGKVDIDDSALYRLPDVLRYRDNIEEHPLVVRARKSNFLYIPLEENAFEESPPGGSPAKASGGIAVMSNGSGMLMSMIALSSKEGYKASCAIDLGGGATKERITEAVKIALSTPGTDALFLNVFGGITRCDEVAAGLCAALENAGYSMDSGADSGARCDAGFSKNDGSGDGAGDGIGDGSYCGEIDGAAVVRTVVVRMEGTNKEKGMELIAAAPGVILADCMNDVKQILRKLRMPCSIS
jgi:succinyl-CoA synthetase beta subunit